MSATEPTLEDRVRELYRRLGIQPRTLPVPPPDAPPPPPHWQDDDPDEGDAT